MLGEKTRERAQAVKAKLVLKSRAQYPALVTSATNEGSFVRNSFCLCAGQTIVVSSASSRLSSVPEISGMRRTLHY